MAGAETIERLRQYLSELSPQTRALLVGEFERDILGGGEAAGADLILNQLRNIGREPRDGAPRIGHCARLFFKPFEPFLVDDRPEYRHPGRIARASLETLWTWIRRDLLPDDAKTLANDVTDALLAGNDASAERFVREFQYKVAVAIRKNFAAAVEDERAHRRMLAQIGTAHPSGDALTLKCVLTWREQLMTMAAQLPLSIVDLDNGRLDSCKKLIEEISTDNGELLLYALLVVMSRMAAPWEIVRFGIKAAASDVAARVAETHYGIAVTIVLAELDRLVRDLRNDLHSGRGVAVGALLKTIHDTARGLRTELDLPIDSNWGRALAASRAQIADLLRTEIESAPGRVRHLLRPRPSSEIRANSVLEPDDVAETESLLEFVGNCRHFAGELALNEMTQRTFVAIQQYLDGAMRALLDGLRHSGDDDRSFRQSQVDAAVRFCAKVFGQDYAALLAKAAEMAGGVDRRVRRAV